MNAPPAICAAFHYYEIPAQVPVLPADYTTEIYLSLNFDLFAAFSGLDPNQRDIEAKNHYRDNGRKEGRRYLPVNAQFDAATYLRLNPGLTAAVAAFTFPIDRKNWAEAHYLYFGHNELRLFMDVPAGFDPLKYLYMNRDLLLAPDIDTPARKCSFAQIHYVNNGRGEGRLYTDVAVNFEPLRYLDLHPDLNAAAAPMSVAHRKVFAYEHFYSSGKNELRKYLNTPAGFNPLRYLSLHPDLSNATDRMTDSDKYAYGQEHYVNYGRAENRAY